MKKIRLLAISKLIIVICLFATCKKDNEPIKLISISVKTVPTKINYYVGESLNLSGLAVTLSTDNGKIEDVAFNDFVKKGLKCSPANGDPVTSSTITVTDSVSNKSVNFDISISNIVTGIEIKTAPLKLNYLVGETVDLSGLAVILTMENGSKKGIASTNLANEGIICTPSNGTTITLAMNSISITHTTSGTHTSLTIIVDNKVVDIDGNIYSYVKIGNQIWLGEDLIATKYADGIAIPNVIDSAPWVALNDVDTWNGAAYYLHNTGAVGVTVYYTWAAAMGATINKPAVSSDATPSNVQGVCPNGWHLPSDGEWKQLEIYLGMSETDANTLGLNRGTNEGSKLAGNKNLWMDSALESNSEFGTSGFLALPNGYRSVYDGTIFSSGDLGNWWSSTQYDGNGYAIYRSIHTNETTVRRRYYSKSAGYCVRCIRN